MQGLKGQKPKLNKFQILTCIYSLKKVQQVELLIVLIGTVKSAKNSWILMIQNKKIKREIPSEYQLNADLYSIPIGNVKKLVPNLFDKESMWFILKTYNSTWD